MKLERMSILVKRIYFGIIIIGFLACKNNPKTNLASHKDALAKTSEKRQNDSLEEFFTDSLSIGRRTHNKINVFLYRTADSIYAEIEFYKRQGQNWENIQSIRFRKDFITNCDVQLNDFNNDGYNDMTIKSLTAARGANEIRRLYLYDKKLDQLINIKNAEGYPNMRYNKKLDCIDAFIITAGSTQYFLKISGDSLKSFASVEIYDGLTIHEYNKRGKERLIYSDTTFKEPYTRFKTYKPLKAYNDDF
jgi:hypothetical protein